MPSRCASRTSGCEEGAAGLLQAVRDERAAARQLARACGWLADIGHLRCAARSRHADPRGSADQPRLQLVQLLEGGGPQPADHLAALALGLDQAGQAQDAQVPADERLGEDDAGRELVDRHRSDLGQQADDAQPGLVAQRAVEGAQPSQVALARGSRGQASLRSASLSNAD